MSAAAGAQCGLAEVLSLAIHIKSRAADADDVGRSGGIQRSGTEIARRCQKRYIGCEQSRVVSLLAGELRRSLTHRSCRSKLRQYVAKVTSYQAKVSPRPWAPRRTLMPNISILRPIRRVARCSGSSREPYHAKRRCELQWPTARPHPGRRRHQVFGQAGDRLHHP